MFKFYPLFIALGAFVVAALLSERAISQMQPDAKAVLVDASASTRLLNIVVAVVFLGLVLWRPIVGWGFLGVAYVCLAGRSVLRVQRLKFPISISRLLQASHLIVGAGMLVCASIFVSRALD